MARYSRETAVFILMWAMNFNRVGNTMQLQNNFHSSDAISNSRSQVPIAIRRAGLSLFMAVFTYTSAMQAVSAEPGVNTLPVEAATGFDPANAVDVIRNGAVMDINHHVDRAVLNWQSFDIGRNASVNFNQLNSSALTLNRIGQGSASQIFGQLNANGRIFLINQNGILFGDGAQINVHELTASTLNITDEVFENGILSAIENQDPAFSLFTDSNGDPLPSKKIIIEDGAVLNSGIGGRIMILAPDIENSGVINSPDGQVILAAGKKVYLTGSDDPSLRGILVEISNNGDENPDGSPINSEIKNLGDIISERGNVTLAGLAINQDGRISATTTTSANGSIRLIARDTSIDDPYVPGNNTIVTDNTGKVTLGENSVTEILAELNSDDTAVDDQTQFKSRVEIVGKKIHLKENSLISAKGGEVEITAQADPSASLPVGNTPVPRDDDVVVQIEAGSKIDVSGNSTTLAMSRNNLTVELRGNELRDLPLQRNGELRGESVVVDIRRADDFEFGDISGNLAGIERTVVERTSTGGDVTINSEGDIRFLEGAEIDVSGGVINFSAGEIKTTTLFQGNEVVDIHDADPNQLYEGVYQITSRQESGYKEGKDAGTVQFASNGLIVDGELKGNVVAGRYQRDEATRPQGGRLLIGLPGGQDIQDFRAPNITLQDLNLSEQLGGFNIDIEQNYDDLAVAGFSDYRDELLLSLDFLKSGGFTRADLNSNGSIVFTSGSSLSLKPNSQISLKGDRVEVNRSILSQSGDFEFVSKGVNSFANVKPVGANSGVYIGDNVTLEVSGNWTNDDPAISGVFLPTSPVMLDGGSITVQRELSGSTIRLGDNVSLLALGGAQKDLGGNLIGGKGGDIAIEAQDINIDLQFGSNNLLAAHGVDSGGTLRINANAISVEGMSVAQWRTGQSSQANGGVTTLPDFFFSDLGFSNFDINANQGSLTIASGANLDVKTSNLFVPAAAQRLTSRSLASLLSVSGTGILGLRASPVQSGILNSPYLGFGPAYDRQSTSLKLSATNQLGNRQMLRLADGAVISADAGSTMEFINESGGWIDISGDIAARGSNLDFSLGRPEVPQSFNAGSAVVFSDTSSIDISGTFVAFPDTVLGLNRAKTFNAGDITVSSSGYIVLENGAVINAIGRSGKFDVSGGVNSQQITLNKLINVDAGNINFRSAEGILNYGDLNLAAAGNTAYAGTLSYSLDRGIRGNIEIGQGFFTTAPEISITQSATNLLPGNFTVADAINNSNNGKLIVGVTQVEGTDADRLLLNSVNGSILMAGDSELSLRRDIILDAPIFKSSGGTASLNANYVSLGSSIRGARASDGTNVPLGGGGVLNVEADLLDLQGIATMRDLGEVNLVSNGDIRLRGVTSQLVGELAIEGDLNLTADRIYPTTMSSYVLNAGAGDINIMSAGTSNSSVLSAAGSLTLKANNIDQNGTLLAPMGEINFQATSDLNFGNDSLTSVSANNQSILLGQTLNGLEWLYVTAALNNARVLYSPDQQNMPEKTISLDAANIAFAEGATLDLTGGGDLYNWEFVPGPGGSVDALLAANAGNFFAVLPGVNGYAPYDAQEFRGWDLLAGNSVYLAGGGGLGAGNYAVLPARYALLPGAYLVERIDGFDNIPLNQTNSTLFNGTLVAGFDTVFGTPIRSSNTEGYIIRNGNYANQLAEYNVSTADEIVANIAADNDFILPRLTRDSGALEILGRDSIDLNGNLLTAAGNGGRGALVDISANLLSIVDTEGVGAAGTTEILASSLNRLGAESILIGGSRNFTTSGTDIDIAASDLTVFDNVELSAPEVLLVARNNLRVKSGTSLNGNGVINKDREIYNLDGDSALVRVSAAPQVELNRTNTTGTGTSLVVESDVDLLADRSITLDSSGDLVSDANIGSDVDEFFLGASSISIGDVTGVGGLILNDDKLAQISGLDLFLRTSGQIDLYGSVNLNLNKLEFNASGIVADQTTPAEVIINAGSVSLGNASGSVNVANVNSPTGTITINANELILTEGQFAIEGFSSIDANITGNTTGSGNASLAVNGDLALSTGKFSALDYSDVSIITTGNLTLDNVNASPVTETGFRQIGARLSLQGENVVVDTLLDISVGTANIKARTGDVILGQNAEIDTSGYSINVLGIDNIALPGGDVNLVADQGNVEVKNGSLINVGSGGPGRAAGTVRMLAREGDVSVLGELLGEYPTAPGTSPDVELGGGFFIDAVTIGQSSTSGHDFVQLNSALNAGAFTREREIRQRTGDINIDLANDFMIAQRIKLIAETGDIRVTRANLWTADEQAGGQIELIAAEDLILDQGSWLSVAPLPGSSAMTDGSGGEIILESVNGSIDLKSGFLQIGSLGNDGIESGSVKLRTSRTLTNNDVKIDNFSAVLLGGSEVQVEGVKRYDGVASISSAYLENTVKPETDSFMANASTIKAGLPVIYLDETTAAVKFDGEISLQPGVEIRNDGDIAIIDDIELTSWIYDGEPGILSVRAGGNLNINGNVDGALEVATTLVPKPSAPPFVNSGNCASFAVFCNAVTSSILTDEQSWSFNLTAGADIDNSAFSVDRMQTNSLGSGDLVLASNKLVRSGTGDIILNAANDIIFGNEKSVVYALGRKSGFELDRAGSSAKLVPTDGGDIVLAAGNNITGPGNPVGSKTQLINEWYKREAYDVGYSPAPNFVLRERTDAGTWLDYKNFRQGVAAFGGGNVTVNAGNDIQRLSVSTPTFINGNIDTQEITRLGNGNIDINAGGDVRGAIVFVGDGTARLNAGGDVISGREAIVGSELYVMDTTFAVMGGRIDVQATGNIDIESIYNPTLINMSNNLIPLFSTYTGSTAANFTSYAGTITVDPGFNDISNNSVSAGFSSQNSLQYSLLPPNLRLEAVKDSITLLGGLYTVFPSTNGSVQLYAGTDINAAGSTLQISDEPLSLVLSLNDDNFSVNTNFPVGDVRRISNKLASNLGQQSVNAFTNSRQFSDPPLHREDDIPTWFVAESGDINGGTYRIPEQTRFMAGRDIRNINFRSQNMVSDNVTRLQAGRDITLTASNNQISVSGPGRLEVLAGRNIDLGPSIGIETLGNLTNPVLPDTGADITVMAGIDDGPEYLQFYREYIGTVTDEDWAADKESLIPDIMDIFYAELRAAGRDTGGDFSRGYQAIDTLFPETNFKRTEAYGNLSLKLPGESNSQYFARLAGLSDYEGDLSLFFSKVYSLDGGDVNMLVPGGFVNAGLASAPANAPVKQPGELGVVAQGTGDIRTFSRGDFQVNQSRVSTLLGGDILMWSSVGDIDAGRGSKSAIAAPEPRITITSSGDVQVDLSNTISGSGIRAVVVNPSVEPGDVDLIAPNGIVDAGDAGIASSGNINIAAVQVIGADNIQFGGIAVGVPSSNTGAVGGSGFSGAGNVAGNASRVAEDAASDDESQFPLREKIDEPQLTFISVEILGFGEEEEERG